MTSHERSRARLGSAIIACLMTLTVIGCARPANVAMNGRHPWTHPGHLVVGSSDEPDNLNPMYAHTDATDAIDALVFAPVFRYGEFVPELATVVPTYGNGGIAHDGKTITLHWRPNVTWSDGEALTPRDLRFTWRAVENKRNNTKLSAGWDDISAIDVPDDRTAIVHLKRPNAGILGIFGGGGGAAYPPLPEHLLGKLADLNTAAFNANPISSGPWLLKAWNHASSLEFMPNDRYWRGRPKLDAISWHIVPNPDVLIGQLRTHEVDLDQSVGDGKVRDLTNVPSLTLARHRSANWRRLAINCTRPALSRAFIRVPAAPAAMARPNYASTSRRRTNRATNKPKFRCSRNYVRSASS